MRCVSHFLLVLPSFEGAQADIRTRFAQPKDFQPYTPPVAEPTQANVELQQAVRPLSLQISGRDVSLYSSPAADGVSVERDADSLHCRPPSPSLRRPPPSFLPPPTSRASTRARRPTPSCRAPGRARSSTRRRRASPRRSTHRTSTRPRRRSVRRRRRRPAASRSRWTRPLTRAPSWRSATKARARRCSARRRSARPASARASA